MSVNTEAEMGWDGVAQQLRRYYGEIQFNCNGQVRISADNDLPLREIPEASEPVGEQPFVSGARAVRASFRRRIGRRAVLKKYQQVRNGRRSPGMEIQYGIVKAIAGEQPRTAETAVFAAGRPYGVG